MKKRGKKFTTAEIRSASESLRKIASESFQKIQQSEDELERHYGTTSALPIKILNNEADGLSDIVETWIARPVSVFEDVFEFISKADLIFSDPGKFKYAAGMVASDFQLVCICFRVFASLEPSVPTDGEWPFSFQELVYGFSVGKFSAADARQRLNNLAVQHATDVMAFVVWAKVSTKNRVKSGQTKPRERSKKASEIKKTLIKREIRSLQKLPGDYPTRFTIQRHLSKKGITAGNDLLAKIREEFLAEQLDRPNS